MNNENLNTVQFPEVVVVQASAGAGKTYALAKRYLQLLINPQFKWEYIPLRFILAITFTNKATIEMKERILEFLKKIAFNAFINDREKNDILASLKVDEEYARKKSYLIMDEIIKHYNFFQVKTIDSFINALLLGSALRIDRSASFKIKRQYTDYLAFCLDLVIEEARKDSRVWEFLEEFLEHYLFVENRKGWLPKEDILILMRSLFTLSNKYGKVFKPLSDMGSKEVIKKKKALYKNIEKLSWEFLKNLNSNAQKSIKAFLKNTPVFEIKKIPTVFKELEVPSQKGEDVPETLQEAWKKIRCQITEVVELEAFLTYSPYIKLFNRLIEFLQIISQREDVLFLEELNRKAKALFDEQGITVAELYYNLATRFKHYLIDEFQDTSVLQWRNLYIMVEEALSCGGSLFYVGDKKQAIYRFRGGESQLFNEVKNNFEHFGVKSAYLNKNWRSQKAIVEFNNRVFSYDNLISFLGSSGIIESLEDNKKKIEEITSVYKDDVQEYKEENIYGYVCVERIEEKNKEERNEIMKGRVLALIEELTQRFSYDDIAILARDNDEVELVSCWLLGKGIPVESEKTLNILQNYLIKELLSFLSFLYSPVDDLSFAGFIRGEIFSSVSGVSCQEITEFIISLHKEGKIQRGISLYRYFRDKYPLIWSNYIEDFFRNVGFVSLYELVCAIYNVFGVMEKFADSQAFFMKFLELIKDKEDEYVGLGDFLLYLKDAEPDDLYVNVTPSNSVQILTIHKSKGLEFPVVIVPFLCMEISPETGGKSTNSYVVGEENEDLGLVRLTQSHCLYSPTLQEIYTEAYKKACIDELNALYVALTRAQYELYIYIPRKSGTSNNKARYLIPQDLKEVGIKRTYEKKAKETQELLWDIPPSKYHNWVAQLKGEFADAGSLRNRLSILEGNVMHAFFSRISNIFDKDINEVLEEGRVYVQSKFPFIKDFSGFEQRASEIIKKNEIRPIFYLDSGQVYPHTKDFGVKVYCEKEVVNRFGDTKRIDRLIVTEKFIWVVDYKSSRDGYEGHCAQVKEYLDIISEIYPDKQVKGFIIYFDEQSIEEIFR